MILFSKNDPKRERKLLLILVLGILFLCTGLTIGNTNHDPTTRYTLRHNVKGTKMFIDHPSNFEYLPILNIYMKDSCTYIQFTENPHTSYYAMVKKMDEKLAQEIDNWDDLGLIRNRTKVGRYDGVFLMDSMTEAKGYIHLTFGDENFFCHVAVNYCPNTAEEREELLSLLQSIEYRKEMKKDYFETQSFDVNLKGSQFKPIQVNANNTYYTLYGKIYQPGEFYINSFLIGTIPHQSDVYLESAFHKYLESVAQNFPGLEGDIVSGTIWEQDSDSLLKANMRYQYKGKEVRGVIQLRKSSNGILLFYGQDVSGKGKYLKQYNDIMPTIRWKVD